MSNLFEDEIMVDMFVSDRNDRYQRWCEEREVNETLFETKSEFCQVYDDEFTSFVDAVVDGWNSIDGEVE